MTSNDRADRVWEDLRRIRAEAPLIHNITNFVVMNITANALLAAGASPVMAHAAEEVEEMATLARALVINIGTLDGPWVEAMVRAGRAARQAGRPIVLDPVGAGATRLRTAAVRRLLAEAPPAIIRGNASEIRAVLYDEQATKGVDSTHASEDALDAARALAARTGAVVSVSGAVDLVVSGTAVTRIANGHPLMPRVTGLGCVATALTGAFAAVNSSPADAAAHAMAVMGMAGEMAGEGVAGPGSFVPRFLDALHTLDAGAIRRRLKLEEA